MRLKQPDVTGDEEEDSERAKSKNGQACDSVAIAQGFW